jgi:hypothetical protein
VSTAFPAWQLPTPSSGDQGLGFMQYGGAFVDGGSNGPMFGRFDTSAKMQSALQGGPIVIYDAAGTQALVHSVASSFMASSIALNMTTLRAGVLGSALELPAGYSTSSVLWYGNAGINPTVMAWGAGLLALYGKALDLSKHDFTNNYLIYNTDHVGVTRRGWGRGREKHNHAW